MFTQGHTGAFEWRHQQIFYCCVAAFRTPTVVGIGHGVSWGPPCGVTSVGHIRDGASALSVTG